MEARVQRFHDLGRLGRPYKVFNLVLLELQILAHTKDKDEAAREAENQACFYEVPELDPWYYHMRRRRHYRKN